MALPEHAGEVLHGEEQLLHVLLLRRRLLLLLLLWLQRLRLRLGLHHCAALF